jgi:hypothetical protein
MLHALCPLLFRVDITPPVVYSAQRREVRENLRILGALIFGIVIRIILTSEDVILLASFNLLWNTIMTFNLTLPNALCYKSFILNTYEDFSISNAIKEDQMDNDTLVKQIIRRLDVLIALQIEILGGPKAALSSMKIRRLTELGLSSSEVAEIVGKSLNYVTATLSQQKKGMKRKETK